MFYRKMLSTHQNRYSCEMRMGISFGKEQSPIINGSRIKTLYKYLANAISLQSLIKPTRFHLILFGFFHSQATVSVFFLRMLDIFEVGSRFICVFFMQILFLTLLYFFL